MSAHIQAYKKYVRQCNNGEKVTHSCTCFKLFDKYGKDNLEIVLLANVNAESREELQVHERKHIIKNIKRSVNRHLPINDKRLQNLFWSGNLKDPDTINYMREYFI